MRLPATHTKLKIFLIITFFFALFSGAGYAIYDTINASQTITSPVIESPTDKNEGILNNDEAIDAKEPIALTSEKSELEALQKVKHPGNPEDTTKNFNILILGIDRRDGGNQHWRTDVIQLLTLSPNRKNAVITHIPRDIWAGGYKINAVYNLQGPEPMKDIIEEITGQRPDRIIRVDFDAFVWIVDSVGGLTIDVPNGFTDTSYPNDRKGYNDTITISFKPGQQTMDGEEALTYARSRHGNNNEGSDYARGTRQQIVMRAILDDFFTPDNLFKPKTGETLYKIATRKVYTDMNMGDVKILFEILKNYKNITVRQISLSTENYLKVPSDRSLYGNAWTLIPKGTYQPIHDEINLKLE